MKRILTLGLLALMSVMAPVSFAEGFSTLKFTSESGDVYSVSTNDLEILVDGENLTFNNTDLVIPLSSLISMEFADHYDEPAGIESVSSTLEGAVTVYGIDGVSFRVFNTYTEALNSLGKGIFVIKDSTGKTLKVKVWK